VYPSADFFQLTTLSGEPHGPYIRRLHAAEINGLVVQDALDPGFCARWVHRLEHGEVPIEPTRFSRDFEAFSYGPCLDQSEGEGDISRYLQRVAPFESSLRSQVTEIDLLRRVSTLLTSLNDGCDLDRPTGAGGMPYGLITLRRIPPGGNIPPHCENEQLPRPSYRELLPQIDPSSLLSFYFTLQAADEGGELSVHDIGFDAIGSNREDGRSKMAAVVDETPSVRLSLRPGALILFDGGRKFHQVLPVRGHRTRWTLGGFLAPSRDGRRVLAWA
jgi:hypothetical protein